MIKLIKKYGNTCVIRLNNEDKKIYELKEGDIVQLHVRKIKKEDVIQDGSNK